MSDYSNSDTPVSPIKAGLGCRCPRCGKGKLFNGILEFAEGCKVCDLDYAEFEKGDGPAVFIILILGFIVVGFALLVEVIYEPPLWLHAILWGPMIIGGSIWMLRPMKAFIIAMQYSYNAREGQLVNKDTDQDT
ncbi:DUF983 domain-containing protein [Pseudemcibacter aquimaris]|uniref:DUF983 domain-containing protein n=1 Tax=Pseudemcibacter aquimaris TaxID=2857064 RepID=UPI002011797E|nr:DUF983 domain-containing protein [Pseudemcibacter aquimaris]MCC3862461.1 DUF983 domain-containing protein [Pseudemcibacter aquimaris]WDU59111.1 DUF983 domain-containing protein [Pseudemcibacter aquimaris]